jgi:di/tricarboxylate transporter
MKIRRIIAVVGGLAVVALGVYAAYFSQIENAVSVGFVFLFIGLLILASQIRNG